MPYQRPLTRSDAILRQLREEIVTGTLPPDTVIKDAEVAARLGVSITPVREAVARLITEGLVSPGPARTRRVTRVTRKNALDLVRVMEVLACAGVAWGVPRLTLDDIALMRRRLDESAAAIDVGDVTTAAEAGADISTIMITASGNREIQPLVDLVVARTVRLLALTPDSGAWRIWRDAHDEIITHLEQGRPDAAVDRYRAAYGDFRQWIEANVPADEHE